MRPHYWFWVQATIGSHACRSFVVDSAAELPHICCMPKQVTHHLRVKIAAITGLSLRTVDKFYGGVRVNDASRMLIEKAAFEMDLPLPKRSEAPVPKQRPDKPKKEESTGLVLAHTGSGVWEAYADAFTKRYGTPPVRNARVNAQLKQLVARIPADEAPGVARHYLGSENARYVASGHAVGLLLQDCEKLRTEWYTGRSGTAYGAHQADKRAGRGAEYADLFAELRAIDAGRGVKK